MKKKAERQSKTSCWNKALDDEPVFVLRGKDINAPSAVRHWAKMSTNQSHETRDEAHAIADEMDSYRDQLQREKEAAAAKNTDAPNTNEPSLV